MTYYYESSECHESNGIGVIGASPASQGTRTVYIYDALEPGSFLLSVFTWPCSMYTNFKMFKLTAPGSHGVHGQVAPKPVLEGPRKDPET